MTCFCQRAAVPCLYPPRTRFYTVHSRNVVKQTQPRHLSPDHGKVGAFAGEGLPDLTFLLIRSNMQHAAELLVLLAHVQEKGEHPKIHNLYDLPLERSRSEHLLGHAWFDFSTLFKLVEFL